MVRHNRRSTIRRFTFFPRPIHGTRIHQPLLNSSGYRSMLSEWCEHCSGERRSSCVAHWKQTTLRLQNHRERRSLLRIYADLITLQATLRSPRHIHTFAGIVIFSFYCHFTRLLFLPPNCEYAGISCVCFVCQVVVLDKLCSFVYRLCSFHYNVLFVYNSRRYSRQPGIQSAAPLDAHLSSAEDSFIHSHGGRRRGRRCGILFV